MMQQKGCPDNVNAGEPKEEWYPAFTRAIPRISCRAASARCSGTENFCNRRNTASLKAQCLAGFENGPFIAASAQPACDRRNEWAEEVCGTKLYCEMLFNPKSGPMEAKGLYPSEEACLKSRVLVDGKETPATEVK